MNTSTTNFKEQIQEGIPAILPQAKPYEADINHAPIRKDILSTDEKKLAVRNALRYFPKEQNDILAKEFAQELKDYGRIYMYRFRPDYEIKAKHLEEFPNR